MGSVRGSAVAPFKAQTERGEANDIEAYKNNINRGGDEFAGRSAGGKSASLPSDAASSFHAN